jgi:hypothetical protein
MEALQERPTEFDRLRNLTKKIIAHEKYGFWSDWSPEQQEFYRAGDWELFSRSRGYSEGEITDFKEWLYMIKDAEVQGRNPLQEINDLAMGAALHNIASDKNREIMLSSHLPGSQKQLFRNGITKLETQIRKMDGVIDGDCFPVKHTFADGIYVRELSVPKGMLVVTKIHKITHPYFLLKGDVSVLTESGVVRIKAPFSGITPAGTKRICYIHEDCVWTTVHATKETDLDKIEEEIIAKTYEDLLSDGENKAIETFLVGEFETMDNDIKKKNCLILALRKLGRDFSCLLELKTDGVLLPFKESIEKLKQVNVSLDGLFATKQDDGIWHITIDKGTPLNEVSIDDAMLVGSWAAVGIAGAGAVAGFAKSRMKQPSYEEDPNVVSARNALGNFISTGQLGNYTAGQNYDKSFGDFTMTPYETSGLNRLGTMMNSSLPYMNESGTMLRGLVSGDTFNPYNDQGAYKGFAGLVDRATQQGIDVSKRNSAFGRNLYSSKAIRQIGDVAAAGQAQKAGKLSELYQNYIQQKIGGATQLANLGEQTQNMNLGLVGASQTYGALPRTLKTAEDQAYYQDFLRQQNEKQGMVSAAQGLAGLQNAGTMNQGSPWNTMLDSISGLGGNMAGQAFGSYLQNQNNQKSFNRYSQLYSGGGGTSPWTGQI